MKDKNSLDKKEFLLTNQKYKTIRFFFFPILFLLFTSQFYVGGVLSINHQSEDLVSNEPTVPTMTWNKTYSRNNIDLFYSGLETPEGELVFFGETLTLTADKDFWLVKTDPNGEIIWERIYGSEKQDVGFSIIQTDESDFLLAGYTYQHGSADGWLIKTDSEGEQLWNKTYGAPGEELFNEIIQTDDGGFCIAGCTSSIAYGADFFDGWIVKLNATGDVLWSRRYGSPLWDEFYSIIQTSDGGYLLAGDLSTGEMPNPDEFFILKTDSIGLHEWNLTLGDSYRIDCARSIVQTNDGYVIAGEKTVSELGYIGSSADCWLVKINHQGIIEWNQTYGGNRTDYASSIIQLEDGDYAILGITATFGAGYDDLWLIRTDSDGNELWNQTYGTAVSEYAYKLLQTRDNGLLLIGAAFGDNYTAFVLKVGGSIYTQSPTLFFSNPLFLFIPLILLYFTRKKRFF